MAEKHQKPPLLSVVIIGHNEGERLLGCLESVKNLVSLDGGMEIIYVDSTSTDDSVERVKEQGITVLEDDAEKPSAASARNVGWRAAQGKYILFLDGDTVVVPGFVNEGLSYFSDEKIAIVWGHRREIYPRRSIYHRVLDLDWVYQPGLSDFCGGDCLARRSVLEEVGGYDPNMIAGEEPEMCRRIRARGDKILHIDQPMTFHDHHITSFSQYWSRAVRSGHAYAKVARRFQDSDDPFWKREARSNRIHGTVAAITPVLAVLFPYIMISLIFAVLARTMWRARWKSDHWMTLMLYGIHSHFQQIPILWGQISYWRERRRKHE